MNWDRLRTTIRQHEGKRLSMYKDSLGVTTIGIGRNLESRGISDDEAELMFSNDLRHALGSAMRVVTNFEVLDDVRKEVLINMAFNLGQFKLSKFKLMIAAIAAEDYDEAAKQMLDSRWATQVGPRAGELALLMRVGEVGED